MSRETEETEELETAEVEETEEETASEEGGEEETASEEGEETEESEETDGEDDEKDGELGRRAQKRIKGLLAKGKESEAEIARLKSQLDEARKLTGDDGKALIKAAETAGILPGLMTRDEAEAFRDLAAYPGVIEGLEDWIDDHGEDDEYEANGKTLTYGQVKKRLRKLRGEYAELKDEYGPRRKELQRKVRDIFELGVAAQKAGWKPDGSGRKPAKTKPKTTPERASVRPARTAARRAEDIDVEDADGLEAFMAANRRKKN